MSHPLAVFAPQLGSLSETFIRRQMEDLLPGHTVVVARTADPPFGQWTVDCPLLILDRVGTAGGVKRFVGGIARRLGVRDSPRLESVKRFLRGRGVQVIVSQYLDWSLQWLDFALGRGIRFFAHAHGYDISRSLREPRWRAGYLRYNEATGVITMSERSRDRLVGLGLGASRIHVVPYGVDVPERPVLRPEQRHIRCLAVGRMVGKKAPILTLDAFRRAAAAYPSMRLDYVGTGQLLSAAMQFVRAFDMGDRVTLHGGQPSEVVHRLMRDADIFVQHSMTDPDTGDEEGLPVAILEAMAASLPVVSTTHAGIPEAVSDGLTGYLVSEGDSSAMADHILALARDADLRNRMGAAGWHRAKEHFSWERERRELLRVLDLTRPAASGCAHDLTV